jgi:hypothetical protein
LQNAIADLQSEISSGHKAGDISAAFTIVVADTQNATEAVNALDATDRAAEQDALQQALSTEASVLHRALARVNFSQRVTFTTQLGSLGETVPTITQVGLSAGSTLIITGTHFAPGAQVALDGHLIGSTSQNAAGTQITLALRSNDDEGEQMHTVGVQNPDGTAAQAPAPPRSAAATPAPGATPTPNGRQGTPEPGDDGGTHHGTPTPQHTATPDP